MAFLYDQLCEVIKAVIDSTFHGVQDIWDKKLTTKDWGFLLVDAKNAFNKINRIVILWTVRHLCPSGYYLVFNCYPHCPSLIM